jgi:lipopolysaccharide transport system permease protein
MAEQWLVNEPTRGLRAFRVSELWESRDLALLFATRDLKVRYRQAVFGVAWALVQPLLGALVLVFVFGRVAEISTGDVPHLPFALIGYAAWTYFSASSSAASQSLVQHADLVTKVYFPRLLLPIGALLPRLLDLGIGLVLGLGVAAWLGVGPPWAFTLVPAWIALLVLASTGFALLFGALNVRFRDAQFIFPMLVQILFFLTPIAYPAGLVSDRWLTIYALNPFAGIVSGLRWSLIGAGHPESWWLISMASALVILAVGAVVFQQGERRFADVI